MKREVEGSRAKGESLMEDYWRIPPSLWADWVDTENPGIGVASALGIPAELNALAFNQYDEPEREALDLDAVLAETVRLFCAKRKACFT
jgi:hypothetical protein